ncbi:MAG: amidohydrolase [Chloroflexi bacterium]|nr:amidohydrolase [Chloroflexota bacterium]
MPAAKLAADTVLHNGKIITVDRLFSIAEAVAIHRGKFVAVGADGDVKRLAADHTRVIDLKGATVVPGLMDCHVHQLRGGGESKELYNKVYISFMSSIAEMMEAIRERVAHLPPGEWLMTSLMYRGALKEGRFPNRWDLDKVAPNNPIYVFQSGKNCIVNSYALRLAGIDRDTKDPDDYPEGYIVRDENGEPTGHLIAGAADRARGAWWKAMGKPPRSVGGFLYFDRETNIQSLKANMAMYNASGVVGVRDMGLSPGEIEDYTELWRRGEMTTRTNVILGVPVRFMTLAQLEAAIRGYYGPKQPFGDEWLRIGGLKMIIQNDGWWAYSPEKVRLMILEGNRNGWTMLIHVTTGGIDDSVELVFDVLEEANREKPFRHLRWCYEHGFGLQKPEHYRRLAELGLIIAANPLLSYYASARSFKMHDVMEQTRIAKVTTRDPWARTVRDWGMPIRSWIAAGNIVSGGSDNGAVPYDKEHPLLGMYSAITGNTLAGVLMPGEGVSREDALRMYTINCAYATFEENIKGSIEIGKLGDLVVLDGDILTAPEEAIKEMKVSTTIVGGKIVYERH